jgi:hypothetical protein
MMLLLASSIVTDLKLLLSTNHGTTASFNLIPQNLKGWKSMGSMPEGQMPALVP